MVTLETISGYDSRCKLICYSSSTRVVLRYDYRDYTNTIIDGTGVVGRNCFGYRVPAIVDRSPKDLL